MKKIHFVLLCLVSLISVKAKADFTDLLPLFGGAGVVETNFEGGLLNLSGEVTSMVVQSDGKVVVVGKLLNSQNYEFAVVRYNADGSLDSTFGVDGLVTTQIGGSDDEAVGVAINGDFIYVAGNALLDGVNNFVVVSYNLSDGSLNTNFGSDGIAETVAYTIETAYAMAIDSAGHIYVAGMGNSAGGGDNFLLVRFTSAGALDTTYNSVGFVDKDIVSNSYDTARALVIDPSDDSVILAGDTCTGAGTGCDFALVKYDADGILVEGFGTFGIATVPLGEDEFGYAVGLQNDGSIIVAGESTGYLEVIKLDSNQEQDATFNGNAGKKEVVNAVAYALAIDESDNIYVGGYKQVLSDRQFYLLKLAPTGEAQVGFGGTDFGSSSVNETVKGIALDTISSSQRIYVAGNSGSTFGVARVNADGSYDNGTGADSTGSDSFYASDSGSLFSSVPANNIIKTTFLTGLDQLTGSAIDADGNLVVVGTTYNAHLGSDIILARYTPNGELDTSFGSVLTPGYYVYDDENNEAAHAVVIQADGKIVVVGSTDDSNSEGLILRFVSDGSELDTTFGLAHNGTVLEVFGDIDGFYDLNDVAIAKNGAGNEAYLIVVGYGYVSDYFFAMAQYNIADGSLNDGGVHDSNLTDTVFGTEGYVMDSSFHVGTGIAVDSNQNLLISGSKDSTRLAEFSYLITGEFNGLEISGLNQGAFADVAIDSQDRSVFVGSGYDAGSELYKIILHRKLSNFDLDTDFGDGGVVETTYTDNLTINAVTILSGDRILVAGSKNGTFFSVIYSEAGEILYVDSSDFTSASDSVASVVTNGDVIYVSGSCQDLLMNGGFNFCIQALDAQTDGDEDGYTANFGDCDDTKASVNPDGTEVCGDGIDQDCSGHDLSCTCGDGHTDIDEECDGGDDCNSDCTLKDTTDSGDDETGGDTGGTTGTTKKKSSSGCSLTKSDVALPASDFYLFCLFVLLGGLVFTQTKRNFLNNYVNN